MPPGDLSADTVLIVDDEEPVRRTFREWLEGADLGCRVLAAADAESALLQANQQTIDLAVLDWNLGAGSDGLQLLEDLALFNPDVVAIMITGFAHQATPLDAMRMGVRDYLDKNHDLDRATFLRAIRRQLDRIRPARRERRLHQGLAAFRAAVEKVLPLVQASSAMTDPVPLPAAVQSLFRFLMGAAGARDGALLVRGYDPGREPAELCRVYGADGRPFEGPLAPFSRSVAGGAVGLGEPCLMVEPDHAAATGAVELHPFEKGRRSLLAAPLNVSPGVQAVLELFDKQSPGGASDGSGFTEADRRLAAAAADFGAEMLRQALAERQTRGALFDAVEAALGASDSVAESLRGAPPRPDDPPPPAVLDRLREGLNAAGGPEAGETLRLAEAVRVLALRHGARAVRHCAEMAEGLRRLLDEAAGAGGGRALNPTPPADVFAEVFALLTPDRLLRDPRADGEGVTVCVVDSGIERALLEEKYARQGVQIVPVEGGVFTAEQPAPLPYGGRQSAPHGTTVADVILTLAPRVRLWSADVFGPRGTCEVEVVIRALRWAVDVWKCKVINLSLGVPEARLQQAQRRQQLQRAVEEAYFKDVLVVAAAHNDHPLTRSYPAAFGPQLLSVDKRLFADPLQFAYDPREQVEFLAHGRGYLGPFAAEPATSWAAPHLTGIAARILTLRPDLKPFEMKTILYWLFRAVRPERP